ncbi:MAG: hypothetical protein ACRYG7_45375 [Janthinobacterium lividum]
MTHHRFQLLRPRAQLLYTLLDGVYLAKRWEEKAVIKLYYLPDKGRGFFAEVGPNEGQDCFVVLRSFSDSEALAEYAQRVRLPE